MSERLSITPLGPYIGALVSGADLTRPLSDNQFEQLYHAVLRHQVVFLREQAITPQQQRALAQRFGDLHIHPVYPTPKASKRLSCWIPITITRRITITGTPM
ncbi:taurine dioxygenase [Citrobacter koseri]|nr:taurine dioxygenase [Citrobacter koseri]